MKALYASFNCTGDPLTAISLVHKMAKSVNETLILEFKAWNFSISVSPDSNVVDLGKIADLELKLFKKLEAIEKGGVE